MWTEILREAAEEVRARVMPLLGGRVLPISGDRLPRLKALLDAEAERAVEEVLERRGVRAHIVSEEAELQLGGGSETRIVVDPVDGTNNLSRGFPLAAVSIAVSETPLFGGVVAGLVMNLFTGEAFWAERGAGARWDGRPIFPSGITSLEDALLSVDVSKVGDVKTLEGLLRRGRHLRQLGSAALSLSLIAAGVLDAYVDLRGLIRVVDVAAGLFILREAGGEIHVLGESLGEVELERDRRLSLIASANPPLMEEILRSLGLDTGR